MSGSIGPRPAGTPGIDGSSEGFKKKTEKTEDPLASPSSTKGGESEVKKKQAEAISTSYVASREFSVFLESTVKEVFKEFNIDVSFPLSLENKKIASFLLRLKDPFGTEKNSSRVQKVLEVLHNELAEKNESPIPVINVDISLIMSFKGTVEESADNKIIKKLQKVTKSDQDAAQPCDWKRFPINLGDKKTEAHRREAAILQEITTIAGYPKSALVFDPIAFTHRPLETMDADHFFPWAEMKNKVELFLSEINALIDGAQSGNTVDKIKECLSKEPIKYFFLVKDNKVFATNYLRKCMFNDAGNLLLTWGPTNRKKSDKDVISWLSTEEFYGKLFENYLVNDSKVDKDVNLNELLDSTGFTIIVKRDPRVNALFQGRPLAEVVRDYARSSHPNRSSERERAITKVKSEELERKIKLLTLEGDLAPLPEDVEKRLTYGELKAHHEMRTRRKRAQKAHNPEHAAASDLQTSDFPAHDSMDEGEGVLQPDPLSRKREFEEMKGKLREVEAVAAAEIKKRKIVEDNNFKAKKNFILMLFRSQATDDYVASQLQDVFEDLDERAARDLIQQVRNQRS